MKLLPEYHEFEEMQQICDVRRHFNIITTSRIGHCAAVRVCVCVFYRQAVMGNVRYNYSRNTYLVCEKSIIRCQDIAENADHRQIKAPLGSH